MHTPSLEQGVEVIITIVVGEALKDLSRSMSNNQNPNLTKGSAEDWHLLRVEAATTLHSRCLPTHNAPRLNIDLLTGV